MKRRDGYWGKAPYLDEIQFIDLGTDISAHLAALAAGQVDAVYRVTVNELDLAKRLPNVQLVSVPSAATRASSGASGCGRAAASVRGRAGRGADGSASARRRTGWATCSHATGRSR